MKHCFSILKHWLEVVTYIYVLMYLNRQTIDPKWRPSNFLNRLYAFDCVFVEKLWIPSVEMESNPPSLSHSLHVSFMQFFGALWNFLRCTGVASVLYFQRANPWLTYNLTLAHKPKAFLLRIKFVSIFQIRHHWYSFPFIRSKWRLAGSHWHQH